MSLGEDDQVALKRTSRRLLRWLLKDRERFELWSGLTFFTLSLVLFLAGWTVLRDGPGAWVAVPSAMLAVIGLFGLSGKLPLSSLILNRGLVAYQPKRGGQMAIVYGACLFGLGVFGLSNLAYQWFEPLGSYGVAALLSTALMLGGLYIVGSTPVLDVPTSADFEADRLLKDDTAEPAWYEVDEDELHVGGVRPEPFVPEAIRRYAVPLVRSEAAVKRPGMLDAGDVVAWAMIDGDWVETPTNYSCVTVTEAVDEPCLDEGDVVGINHAISDTRWLVGRCVAVWREGRVMVGRLNESEGRLWLRSGENESEVEAVQIVGAVEWSLKAGSKHIRSDEAMGALKGAAGLGTHAVRLDRGATPTRGYEEAVPQDRD